MRKFLFIGAFFCLCFSRAFALDTDTLMVQARSLVNQDKSRDAALLYEEALGKDSTSYEPSAFLGNYYFLLGKKALNEADAGYRAITQPNRMQMAHHQDQLKYIYHTYYEKAGLYLQKALRIQKNEHLKTLLDTILAFKQKIGLVPALDKK